MEEAQRSDEQLREIEDSLAVGEEEVARERSEHAAALARLQAQLADASSRAAYLEAEVEKARCRPASHSEAHSPPWQSRHVTESLQAAASKRGAEHEHRLAQTQAAQASSEAREHETRLERGAPSVSLLAPPQLTPPSARARAEAAAAAEERRRAESELALLRAALQEKQRAAEQSLLDAARLLALAEAKSAAAAAESAEAACAKHAAARALADAAAAAEPHADDKPAGKRKR
jgi:hypothetical protein